MRYPPPFVRVRRAGCRAGAVADAGGMGWLIRAAVAATLARGQDGRGSDPMALAGVSTAEPCGFRGGRIGERCCPAWHLPSPVSRWTSRDRAAMNLWVFRRPEPVMTPLLRARLEKGSRHVGEILRRCPGGSSRHRFTLRACTDNLRAWATFCRSAARWTPGMVGATASGPGGGVRRRRPLRQADARPLSRRPEEAEWRPSSASDSAICR